MSDTNQLCGSLSGVRGLTANVTIPNIAVDWYTGPYDITPSVDIQMLLTEDKTLSENVVVLGIPYAEVSNTSGGYTAVIG